MLQPIINHKVCQQKYKGKSCSACESLCPTTALYCDTTGSMMFSSDLCNQCKACVKKCPARAIKMFEINQLIPNPKEPMVKVKE